MRTHARVAVLAALMAAGLFPASAAASLVGYWNFDADNAVDLSGFGNNGAVGAAVTFTSQTPLGVGRAAQSTRTGASTITVANSPSLESLNSQLTLSFWMKAPASPDNANWFRIFRKGTEAEYQQSWMVNRYSDTTGMNMRVDTNLNPSTLYPGFNQNIAHADGTTILDDQWHHLVFIMDNGQWRKYVDGMAKGSGSYTHNNGFSNTQPLQMLTGNYMGLLDDVALWNEPLTAAQARSIYNVPKTFNLDYDLGDMMTLWTIYAAGPGAGGGIDGIPWQYVGSLPGSHAPGDAFVHNNIMYIALGDGSGLAAIPEPSTLTLGIVAFLGLAFCRWRRNPPQQGAQALGRRACPPRGGRVQDTP